MPVEQIALDLQACDSHGNGASVTSRQVNSLEDVFKEAKFTSVGQIREAVLQAGLRRIRPCLMTTATTIMGLAPIFWVDGRGSDVMRPMAIPSIGGMTVQLITLFIVPCLFCWVEEWKWKRLQAPGTP